MVQKITLPNGVCVVCEAIEHVRSVSFGIWVGSGSRHEPAELGGISHFIEHMVFKGTDTRSAADIAMQMDVIGGNFNAFTTKECTCFYLKTLDKHLLTGVEILKDMVLHSRFAQEDVELERGVILEEIGMYEDTPEDVATEKVFEGAFAGSALGRPILGTADTLGKMTGETLRDYIRTHYRPQDTVIAIAGHFSQDDLDAVCAQFADMQGVGRLQIEPAQYHPCIVTRPKEIEQNHICLGFRGLPMKDKNRYVLQLMNNILGGGMSSRLFQTVREKNGLCYSVYSFNGSHQDTGMFGIYTALGQEMERRAIELILQVVHTFCEHGPTEQEMDRCRDQLKTTLFMGLESTSVHMNHLARGELYYGEIVTPDEIIKRYEAVTAQEVLQLAQTIFDAERRSLCAVGKTASEEEYAALLRKA